MPPQPNGSLLRFGVFDLNPQTGVLRKNGRALKLQPQPAKVLALLVARPNELITREELREQIWGNGSFGDFEHALNVCINQLRVVLDDNAESPRWIETVPRRGYRFLAPVERIGLKGGPGVKQGASLGQPVLVSEPSDLSGYRAPGARWERRMPWGVVALVTLSFCFGAGYLVGKRKSLTVSPPSFTRLTYQRGTIFSARFAPDGHVIYGASWDNKPIQLFTTRADFPEPLPLQLKSASLLAISKSNELAIALNGKVEAFPVYLNGTLARAPLAGGSPREMMEDVRYADWDTHGQLAVVHHVAGRSRLEYPIGKVLYQTGGWISHIRISPQGDKIAFLDHPTWADDDGSVATVDLQGTKRTLCAGWTTLQGLAWSPNGKEVWFTASETNLYRQLLAVDLSGKQRMVLRLPNQVTLQDIAADGRVLLSTDEERDELVAFRPHDKGQKNLSWFDSTLVTGISANGQRILLDEQGRPTGSAYYVGVTNIDGAPPVRLGEGFGGGFSPDERWTASGSRKDLESTLLLPLGTGQPVELKHKGIVNSGFTNFMPDGRHLVYNGVEPGHPMRTYIQDLSGGTPHAVTPEGARANLPSPDGKYLAGFDAEHNVTVFSLEGGQPRGVPGIPRGFIPTRWSPDGRYLYVFGRSVVPCKVYRVDWRSGHQELIQELIPNDPAGVFEVFTLVMTPEAELFVYDLDRILSELYVVDGLR